MSSDLALSIGQPAPPARSLVVELHQRLRGRYVAAGILAAALAPCLALAGYLALKPEYKSTGIVRVAPTLPRLLYESEENKLPPLFDSYVSAQATYLQTPRVLDRALDPTFKVAVLTDRSLVDCGWPTGPEGAKRLRENLSVGLARGSQLISVSVSDPSPAMAQSAVNAVLAAYNDIYGEEGEQSTSNRERILQERKSSLEFRLSSVQAQIWRVTEKQGPDTLDRLHMARIDELQRIDAERLAIETALVAAQSRVAAAGPPDAAKSGAERRELALAKADPMLASLLQEREILELEIGRLSSQVGPAHRDMVRRRSDLERLNEQITSRVVFLEESGVSLSPEMTNGDLASLPPEQLRSMLQQYDQIRARVAQQADDLGAKRQEIGRLKDQEAEARKLLDETSNALEAVKVEKENIESGRISVAQWGDLPLSPATDRRIPLAMAGGAAGVGAGLGVFLLLGLVDRRYRFSDELMQRDAAPPRLGVLPELLSGDEEQQEQVRVGVHQIRNQIANTVDAGDGGRVICITSAMPGDGKTSLVMALGLSFASSGERTLVIDADLVGRGLTRTLSLASRPGLRELLEKTRAVDDVLSSCYPGLHAIASGSTTDFAPEHMSPSQFRRLIETLRKRFDTILIDTGPLLGSIEADLVAGVSDSTVLVVSRGQSHTSTQECFRRLRESRRHCAGYVFNRATVSDFRRSASHFSTSRAALPAAPGKPLERQDLMNALLVNMRLGRLLCRMGKITEEQLEEALRIHEETGAALGEVLIDRGFITEEDLTIALQRQRHRSVADDEPHAA